LNAAHFAPAMPKCGPRATCTCNPASLSWTVTSPFSVVR